MATHAQRDMGGRLDSSPPRVFQTGERRSPPSEAADSRRRTRPRHGSFRASQAATSNNTRPSAHAGTAQATSSQHSPPRERVMPPNLPHWYPHAQDPRRSLTTATQSASGAHQPHNYTTIHPAMPFAEHNNLSPPAMTTTQLTTGNFGPLMNPPESHTYPGAANASSGASTAETGQLPGPNQMSTYSQALPMQSLALPPLEPRYNGMQLPSTSATGEAWQ